MLLRSLIGATCCVAAAVASAQSAVDLRKAASIAMPATVSMQVQIVPEDRWGEAMRRWQRLREDQVPVEGWAFGELDRRMTAGALRSGFAVSSDMVVSLNLPADLETIDITTSNGETRSATPVVRDLVTGLVLLKVDGDPMSPIEIRSEQPGVGLPIAVSWMSDGSHVEVDAAVVASDLNPHQPERGYTWKLDSDVSASAIGAPVVDADGGLVGIVTWSSEGQALCLPATHLSRLLETAKNENPSDLTRGRIGITLGNKEAPEITSVNAEFPAAKAGIRAGDLIEKVGTHNTPSQLDVLAAVAMYRGDDTVDVVAKRGEETIEVQIELSAVNAEDDFHAFNPMKTAKNRPPNAFRIEEGKLVPLGGDDQLDALKQWDRVVVPPPALPRQFQDLKVERSDLEEAMRDLEKNRKEQEKDLKALTERLQSIRPREDWQRKTEDELKELRELIEKLNERIERQEAK